MSPETVLCPGALDRTTSHSVPGTCSRPSRAWRRSGDGAPTPASSCRPSRLRRTAGTELGRELRADRRLGATGELSLRGGLMHLAPLPLVGRSGLKCMQVRGSMRTPWARNRAIGLRHRLKARQTREGLHGLTVLAKLHHSHWMAKCFCGDHGFSKSIPGPWE